MPRNRDYVIHDNENIKGFVDDYHFLSNFHPCAIIYQGMFFKSTEAAYQAAKCSYKDDMIQFTKMTASEAKKEGQLITRKRRDWDRAKYNIMSEIVFYKFLHHKELRVLLLAIGNKYIEESNNWNDVTWGVCDGIGTNWLGKILTATREYFKIIKENE